MPIQRCGRCGKVGHHTRRACGKAIRWPVGTRVQHTESGRTGTVRPKPNVILRSCDVWVAWDDDLNPSESRAFPGWLVTR